MSDEPGEGVAVPGSRRPATIAVTAGRPAAAPDAPLNVGLTPASTYRAGGDLEYGRYANPGWSAFEEALGALEGGQAVAFSSGMAAVTAALSLAPADGTVVAPRHAYAGSLALLADLAARTGLRVRTVDVTDTAAVLTACRGADLLWLENPTNPALEVTDVRALAAGAHEVLPLVVADNTFATPILAQPLALGADVVVHSATKYLAGHSDALLGATVSNSRLAGELVAHRSRTGAVPGTLETFLALRGLRTLHLRVERAQANAVTLAARLAGHPAVERVRYPGFGAVVSIEVRGGATAAEALCRRVALWVFATSLGGVESTLERRRRWPAEAPTIAEGLVRLSVGVEDVEDLWQDLDLALRAAGRTAG